MERLCTIFYPFVHTHISKDYTSKKIEDTSFDFIPPSVVFILAHGVIDDREGSWDA